MALVSLPAAMCAACDDDDGGEPTASPSAAASVTAAPLAWATPPATSDPRLDQIIRYAIAGDEQSLRAYMRITKRPCTPLGEAGPPCVEGESPGTLVDTFATGACEGVGSRPEDVALLPDSPVTLYAARIQPTNAGDRVWITFLPRDGGSYGFFLDYADGFIVGRHNTCGPVIPIHAGDLVFIIPPAGSSITPVAITPTPESVSWATPPATDDPRLDQIIRYAVAGDEQSLRAYMRIHKEACTHMQSPGSGAACRDGEPEGTLVATFSVGVCDGNGARAEDIELLPDEPVTLYAVAVRPSDIGDRTAIIFRHRSGGGAGKDFHFDYDDGRIDGLYTTCGGAENFVANASSFLIPPPQEGE